MLEQPIDSGIKIATATATRRVFFMVSLLSKGCGEASRNGLSKTDNTNHVRETAKLYTPLADKANAPWQKQVKLLSLAPYN